MSLRLAPRRTFSKKGNCFINHVLALRAWWTVEFCLSAYPRALLLYSWYDRITNAFSEATFRTALAIRSSREFFRERPLFYALLEQGDDNNPPRGVRPFLFYAQVARGRDFFPVRMLKEYSQL